MASDQQSLRTLLKRIEELADDGSEHEVCVDAQLFLAGNEDRGSIGCNLNKHPGVARFRDVVDGLVRRSDVSSVLAKIVEVMGEGEYPFTDTLFVCTSAHSDAVAEWFGPLTPDEVGPCTVDGLKGVPIAPGGYRWHSVWWD